MRISTTLSLLPALGLGAALLGTAGCSSDDPRQIEAVQMMANALLARNQEAACAQNVDAIRSKVTCEGMLAQLLHYSPGVRGARVDRRGPSSGWRYSTQVKVPMHYTGPDGSGDLDVTMVRSKTGWQIAAVFPIVAAKP